MPNTGFTHDSSKLLSLTRDTLAYARERGATAAEAEVSEGYGQTVTVRLGEVETIEYNRDKGIGVSVYLGQQRGHASTSDFSPKALRDTVDVQANSYLVLRFVANNPGLHIFHCHIDWHLVRVSGGGARTCKGGK